MFYYEAVPKVIIFSFFPNSLLNLKLKKKQISCEKTQTHISDNIKEDKGLLNFEFI